MYDDPEGSFYYVHEMAVHKNFSCVRKFFLMRTRIFFTVRIFACARKIFLVQEFFSVRKNFFKLFLVAQIQVFVITIYVFQSLSSHVPHNDKTKMNNEGSMRFGVWYYLLS